MKPVVIHQTDLFHWHNDPDDHWDLACQYALAVCGDIELGGILIDYPPPEFGDPAIQSVHQLNHITGLSVPVAVGTPEPVKAVGDLKKYEGLSPDTAGIRLLLRTLEQSPGPVMIHIVGSCRDIAIAARLRPELFREKCRAVYLNAGASSPDSKLEYNVGLDPASYGEIFRLTCPVYWMPCFEMAPEPPEWRFNMGRYGTFYRFLQGELLPYLSENLQKYFLYALGKESDNQWLSYLKNPVKDRLLSFFCKSDRSMYCTAGFFHGAGKTVTKNGEIAGLDEGPADAVFTFEPVEISCREDGYAAWHPADRITNRFLFRINDLDSYPSAMTRAMKTLLMKLP